MSEFVLHTEESAPAGSKEFLAASKREYGMIANLHAGMAEAPAMLEGYRTLAGIFDKTDMSETERQIVLMTNNRLSGCEYCMAAHTSISQAAKVPADVIASLRAGTAIEDAKLEALRQFAIVVHDARGLVKAEELNTFLAAGYTKQTALEVIVGTSLKVMSNYANHLVETPLDRAFQPNAWTAADNLVGQES